MAQVLLFHHALGLTAGCLRFADDLRAAGHIVHTPDLYDGKIFHTISEGVAHAGTIGFGAIQGRGRLAAEALPADLVYAGFSLGVVPAQMLAQTRPGAKGALLCYSAMPASEFGAGWPAGVPVQFHMMDADPWALEGGDLDAARQIVSTVEGAELFLYRGERHLFADESTPDYDEAAATLLKRRALEFLHRVG
jgi:dienelactone hydrolase